ncbi:MAG: DUF1883 domain-containing protein [Chloroflexota bacterium]|nr:DUF1883 domain-containing protein [Chloroflexota bacterium]
MEHLHRDVGHLSRGDGVEVSLGYAANVLLLDNINYQNYRSGRQHKYYGGHYKQSPAIIGIPHAGHWHVVGTWAATAVGSVQRFA